MTPTSKRHSLASLRWVTLLSAIAAAACASTPEPVPAPPLEGERIEVETTEGKVAGVTQGELHTFLGIPYAAPVDGLNRWLPPKPPQKRDGIFDASSFGPACPQTVAEIPKFLLSEPGEVAYVETSGIVEWAAEKKGPDCLRLNIWTPAQLPIVAATSAEPAAKKPDGAPVEDTVGAPVEPDGTATEPSAGAGDDGEESSDDADAPPGADNSEGNGAAASAAAADDAEADAATAAPEPSKGLAVIVQLHASGSENSGSANNRAMNGGLLAKKGVVVVTLNRRLGPVGYMAGDSLFEGDVLKGNRGPMDVIRALEWVRDNIARFGGDPGNVTLWGHSGGGTATWTTLSSPKSEGLVHRAILMSAPIYEWSKEDATKVAAAVLDEWGVKPGDAEALAKVESEDASSTIMSTTVATSDAFGEMSRVAFPVAGTHGTEFLPDDTFAAIENGRYNNIDILVGNCLDDHVVSTLYVPLPDGFALDIANGFIGGLIADDDEGVDKMKAAYESAFPDDGTLAKARLQTDALYRIRALRAAASHSAKTQGDGQGRTYVYQFNWKSPTYPEKIGAFHGADMMFAFGNIDRFPRTLGEKDGQLAPSTRALSDGFSDAIVSFAKTGVPSSDKLPEWPEYDADQRRTMVLDKESAVVSDPLGNLRKLWD